MKYSTVLTSSNSYYPTAQIRPYHHHQTCTSCNAYITYNKLTVRRKSLFKQKSRKTCLEMYVQTNVGMLCCVGADLASVELNLHSACRAQTGTTLHIPLSWRTDCWNFYWNFCSFVWPSARIKWTACSRVLVHSLSSQAILCL